METEDITVSLQKALQQTVLDQINPNTLFKIHFNTVLSMTRSPR
jgi:hypothetical protein